MHRSIRAGLSVLALGSMAALSAYVAPSFAAPPAPAPKADAPTPRVVVVVPPGYEKVTVAGHTALAEPNDVAWVK